MFFLKKPIGARVWRGGQADEKGVEVFDHLPPEVVDRAVALIDDDEVEELDGNFCVVDDGQRLLGRLPASSAGFSSSALSSSGSSFEDGVHALNGADADLAICSRYRRSSGAGRYKAR